MDLFDKAVIYAVKAHAGAVRKDGSPYILHPLEAAGICGTLSRDREILSAAVLHDVVEDAGKDLSEIRRLFGERVAALVETETEEKYADVPPEESWLRRKEESLEKLRKAQDPGTKILWLSDKLSNIRSLYRQYTREGTAMWQRYHEKNVDRQAWYYRTVMELLQEREESAAWQEYRRLYRLIFEKEEEETL